MASINEIIDDGKDVYYVLEHEEMMFRYDSATKKFLRKFFGESEESNVIYSSSLLHMAIESGIGVLISKEDYEKGR